MDNCTLRTAPSTCTPAPVPTVQDPTALALRATNTHRLRLPTSSCKKKKRKAWWLYRLNFYGCGRTRQFVVSRFPLPSSADLACGGMEGCRGNEMHAWRDPTARTAWCLQLFCAVCRLGATPSLHAHYLHTSPRLAAYLARLLPLNLATLLSRASCLCGGFWTGALFAVPCCTLCWDHLHIMGMVDRRRAHGPRAPLTTPALLLGMVATARHKQQRSAANGQRHARLPLPSSTAAPQLTTIVRHLLRRSATLPGGAMLLPLPST